MSANFFETPCKEPSRTDPLFGICDDQNGRKAYTDNATKNKWIATVKNEQFTEVSFTPIDHCILILKEGTNDQESTCDGMLTFQNSLYLVELKEKEKHSWKSEAISQLKNTIKLLYASHDLTPFKYKKAYACNKKHPSFIVLDSETRKEFFKKTNGFRIEAQAEITIK
jgi:hypothetical protein